MYVSKTKKKKKQSRFCLIDERQLVWFLVLSEKRAAESRSSQLYVAGASLVAGCLSGSMGVVTGFRNFARLQTQRAKPDFKGVLDCLVKKVRREGIRGFYKGILSPLLG